MLWKLRMKPEAVQPIPSETYDRAYFLGHMDGADEFTQTQGEALPLRLEYALKLADARPGQRLLDLGCGRGEMTWQCARRGAQAHGVDYARAALEISAELRARLFTEGISWHLEQAVAYALPFANQSFDAVLMLDIVEHLHTPELLAAFIEVRRILRPEGRLIVHTMPNADYYRWGYPIYRLLMKALGQNLPSDPRQRWYRGETHVNVQSPDRLRRTLQAAGFGAPKIWLKPLTADKRVRWLTGMYPLRWVLCNDILAIAVKR